MRTHVQAKLEKMCASCLFSTIRGAVQSCYFTLSEYIHVSAGHLSTSVLFCGLVLYICFTKQLLQVTSMFQDT